MCAYKNSSSKKKKRNELVDQSFDTFDLYRNPASQLDRVIITSHGLQTITKSYFDLDRDQKINYYSSDGSALIDPGTQYIPLNLFIPRETLNGPGRIRNYNLAKYKTDTPESLRKIANDANIDIVSVTKGTDLKHILKKLNQEGLKYKTIEGIFCRISFKDAFLSKLHLKDVPGQKAYADPLAYSVQRKKI